MCRTFVTCARRFPRCPCCRIRELLDDAQQKLGYLKIVTPRTSTADEPGGARKYVVQDGRVVEMQHGSAAAGSSSGASNFGVRSLDPADVARHHANLRRFTFQ